MSGVAVGLSRMGAAGVSSVVATGAAEVLATWRVQAGAVMVLGRAYGTVPVSGVAQGQRMPAARGVFRCLAWTAGGNRPHLFVAAVRLPDRADPGVGGILVLRGSEHQVLTLHLPDDHAEDEAFGHMAGRLAGSSGAALARFMLETLRRPDGPEEPALPHVGVMLVSLLSQAAQPDGCIEIMAAVPETCVLMQGWGAKLSDSAQVVLAGGAVNCFAGQVGGFARSDTAAPATGVMLVLPPQALGVLAGLKQVFVLDDQGLHSRTLVEHRLLNPADSIGHVRHMLPHMRGPAPMLALLQEAVRPRFEGRDTLSGNTHPVRAALDLVGVAPGVGAYVSGWVFDPRRELAALHLCGSAGPVARLDTAWTRVPRPDVSDAFRDEPGFPAPPDHDAGFAVFASDPSGMEPVSHLQFTFTDGDRAFFPIRAENLSSAAFRSRLLAGVDLYKPSGLPIVERHVAPMLSRVRPEDVPPARVLLAGPVERLDAVVVPLAAPCLPRAFLSGFLHDPLESSEQLVLVCGPEWDQARLDTLQELVRFNALPATILLTGQTACPLSAVREAARLTPAESVLVAAPGVCSTVPGWREMLRRAAGGAAFVCPTLLYEDWSIRFAGTTMLRLQDTAPYTHAQAAWAGLPAPARRSSGEADEGVQSSSSGSLECCLLRRPAIEALEGLGALATEAGRELAFFLRLQSAGLLGAWASDVQVYAPENPPGEAIGGRVGRLVDGWVLRQTALALDAGNAA